MSSVTNFDEDILKLAIGEKIDFKNKSIINLNYNKLSKNIDLSKVRFRKVTKIVFDKNEDNIDKLTTVFNAVNTANSDVVFLFKNERKSGLSFYVGVANHNIEVGSETLSNALLANFNLDMSNSNLSDKNKDTGEEDLGSIRDSILNPNSSVSISTTIPSFKDKEENREKFVQSLDKFLLAMQDKEYTAIFLATNINSYLENRKNGYEELYSSLFPLASNTISFGSNSNISKSDSLTASFSETITKSSSKTITKSSSSSTSITNPSVLQKVQMTGITNIIPFAAMAALGAAGGGIVAATGTFAAAAIGTAGVGKAIDKLSNKEGKNSDWFKAKTEGKTNSISKGITESESTGITKGISKGETNTIAEGTSKQLNITYENKYIKNQLEIIDTQLKRIKSSQNYGMFDFAAYFLAKDIDTTIIAANIYNSLLRGEESYVDNSYICSFKSDDSINIKNHLAKFEHPKFLISNNQVSITSMINSKELALALNFPKKSLHGLMVKESIEFGRNPQINLNDENNIYLGNLYHLRKEHTEQKVNLSLNDMTMHTLITGSTGSGKSTTTYNILFNLMDKKIKFLVIEPTKGEYKHIFGNQPDINIFGTNIKHTPLLKINPFSFPNEEIHVLEHIDKLVEIFNACWPMYAAMPAILKEAILLAYENCGWDLEQSYCVELKFPNFDDVLFSLDNIINNKSYSDNTKSDYKGALITRVESLTKGLIKNIFTDDEISEQKLFDENTIIDISRIGSSETKSLIMGIILLKLQQYRTSKSKNINSKLKHITVLEEAHHLLPKTSTETSSESGNIKGKAVEMLSNAIAEMRTYGQGFIIVDQSPSMLDESAIRNTNIKIAMRLSEHTDREKIGKATTLTDEQIVEISKLEQGVAIVYQNGWEEPILCKINKNINEKRDSKYTYFYEEKFIDKKRIQSNILKILALSNTKINEDLKEELLLEVMLDENKWYDNWANTNEKKEMLDYILKDEKERNLERNAYFVNKLLFRENQLSNISNEEKESIVYESINKYIIDLNNSMLIHFKNLVKIAICNDKIEIIEEYKKDLKNNNLI